MSDWEDDDAPTTQSSGFGGGFGRGFGRGSQQNGLDSGSSGGFGSKGFGRGRGSTGFSSGFGRPSNGVADTESNDTGSRGGFGRGGGFGKPRSGFGSSAVNGTEEESSSKSGGFGSFGSRGGFGKPSGGDDSSGFGKKSSFGGFGGRNDESEDVPRGGGFGSRRSNDSGSRGGGGGGGGCYKCGEDGHFARECPSSEGGGGGRSGGSGCHKCGEEGHFARECPSSGGGGGGGGGNSCYKCGQEGHFARECPNEGEAKDADGKPREAPYVPPPPPEGEEEIFMSMQKGINFDKYDVIPVEVTGRDKPMHGIESFEEAGLTETFLSNVKKAKYDKPTPIQKWAIPIIMSGRDLMGCAQTGSGKTAAFLLPVLTKMWSDGLESSQFSESQTPQALVVGPTRELVSQIYNEARKFSYGTMIRPVVVYGGTSVGHQLRQVENGAHLVVGTPGRLLDFINRGKISLSKVKYLILDEADRMLDMGFEPEIRKLVGLGLPQHPDRQTLMFSATFPEEIQKLAQDFLHDYLFATVGRVGGANMDIEQSVLEVTQYDKREKLVDLINAAGSDRTLVFVELKRNADFLASYLSQSSYPTTSIHGDRLQREREEALRDFKAGRAPILVATSVAARGLDIPNVMHVVNFDMPSGIDEYVHRIGRTGRCGNTGRATSFFDPSKDGDLARPLVKILQDAQQEVPPFLEEAAEQSFGTGFGGAGGKFGGRDTRRGKFGGGGRGGGDNFNDDFGGQSSSQGFSGGFSSMGAGDDDDEAWD